MKGQRVGKGDRAWGIGHRAWGIGHGAKGMGYGVGDGYTMGAVSLLSTGVGRLFGKENKNSLPCPMPHALCPFLVTAIALGLGVSPLQAQSPPPPMFENVTISPKFSPDPMEVRGISGGTVPAKNIAGTAETANGPCAGFVDEKPDHTLVLTDFFNYLKLVVQSPEDTTIIVRGPGGTWCNDDFEGKNPGIAGQWLPGTYSIWVGSFDHQYHSYTIRMTEIR